jgi:cell wall-associated NlpC family hydrolase
VRRGFALALLGCAGWVSAQVPAPTASPTPAPAAAPAAQAPGTVWEQLQVSIISHLGRPYVWGATGLKSFDCSGFVWRVMWDTGIPMKRTTARKYWFCLPKVPEASKWSFGNIVFFDDLEHCGIVNDKKTFYHSALTLGTHLSELDPYWRPKVTGVRRIPIPPALALPFPTATPMPTATATAVPPPQIPQPTPIAALPTSAAAQPPG